MTEGACYHVMFMLVEMILDCLVFDREIYKQVPSLSESPVGHATTTNFLSIPSFVAVETALKA